MPKWIKNVLVINDWEQNITTAFRRIGDIAYSVACSRDLWQHPEWHITHSPDDLLKEMHTAGRDAVIWVNTDDSEHHAIVPKYIDLIIIRCSAGTPGHTLWYKSKATGAAVCMTLEGVPTYRSINAPMCTAGGVQMYLHGIPQLTQFVGETLPEAMALQWG